jgi:glycosyltransferase involved in cell wall biosynthesis
VQGHCAVLEGQCRRSGGGIPYRGFAEFEAAVDLLGEDGALRDRLGEAGRRFVERHATWESVLDRYERLVTTARRAEPSRYFRPRTEAAAP